MKISLNWLNDYVNIPTDINIQQLARDLTMSTVEVEAVTDLSAAYDLMVVGLINDVLAHPNADKLRVCRVDIGGGVEKEIVCGGINLSAGMKVAVALPGAKVRWHGEGELVGIKAAKLRGVESYGMICSSSEIGLFDLFPFEEDATIIDLSAFDATPGTPLAAALDICDCILEIDNKSLTNRPDLWGHYGIAREISALYDLPLLPFDGWAVPQSVAPFAIMIDDPGLCRRYVGVRLEGLAVKDAPFAIKSRLWRLGLRPINAIVDVTNYVMLATGQPTHAFDADIISGGIRVRLAGAGEKLLLLNEQELSLTAADLVIADEKEAVALAGVMGGRKDSVLDTTDKIILEIANFDAMSVRRTAARFETRTESATRFEKGIDPERVDLALSLSLKLFNEIYPGLTVTGFCDNFPHKSGCVSIDVSLDWLKRRLGKDIPAPDIAKRLTCLGFQVCVSADTMRVEVPTWRATGDVSISADIMEEVARIYGFDHFSATDISTTFSAAIHQPQLNLEQNIKEYLAFSCGMQEIFSYPWVSDEFIGPFLADGDESLFSLVEPPSPQESRLRFSLLPNLCKAVRDNLRYFDDFALFEAARVLRNAEFVSDFDAAEKLPVQPRFVSAALVGSQEKAGMLFRRMKGMLEALPRHTQCEALGFTRDEQPVWADPAVWLNILSGGQSVGQMGLLAPQHALAMGIKNTAFLLFELNLDALTPFASRSNRFVHIPEYPQTDYDLSVLVSTSVSWEQIENTVRGKIKADSFIREVSFVDEYRGQQIADDEKSISLRLKIGSGEKTLTSQEIEEAARSVIRALEKGLGARLR